MKYILMCDGEEHSRHKSLAKAKETAESESQFGRYYSPSDFSILECLSEWEFQGETKYRLKEKKF